VIVCPNCKHPGSHFVLLSFGDAGFFACKSICEECKEEEA